MMGGACGRTLGDAPDAMHVYTDRLACIAGPGAAHHDGQRLHPLAFTTLSPHTPRVLLNADLGDWGVLEHRSCDCQFGRAGMHLFVARITSPEKLTGEGMSLLSNDIDRIVGTLVERAGGSPEDYQFEESHDARGLAVLTIALHPTLGGIDEGTFTRQIIEALRTRPGAGALAAAIWEDAGSVRIVRRAPELTRGHKQLPITRVPDA